MREDGAVAAWPVTIVAAGGYVAAWLRGWPPARLRRDACYIHRGAATFVQVARPKASPLSLPAAQAPVVLPAPRPETAPAAGPATGPAAGPIPANLDDVLGPGAAR